MMFNKMFNKTNLTNVRLVRGSALLMVVSVLVTLLSTGASAQSFSKVKPMGEWAEHMTVQRDGKPLFVHLRTGYERTVKFPEPITLHTINKFAVASNSQSNLPGCNIAIESDVLGFSPLRRFKQQRVSVRGIQTGIIYDLIVFSSPNGKRQPILMLE